MIRAITLDCDGTLYDLRKYKRLALAKLMEGLFRDGPGMLWKRLRIVKAHQKARETRRGTPPCEDLCQALQDDVMAATGYPAELVGETVARLFYSAAHPDLHRCLHAGVKETLALMGELPLAFGVLSDYPVEEKLKALGLGEHRWDLLMSAEDVGVLKPGRELFLEAARRLGLNPREIVHVGDRVDCDVVGARDAGMIPVLFDPHGKYPNSVGADHRIRDFRQLAQIVRGLIA